MTGDVAGRFLSIANRHCRRVMMKIGGANELIITVSQPDNGLIGITGSVLAPGIIGHVVFLYLYDCHANSFLSQSGLMFCHLKSKLKRAEHETFNLHL